MKQIRPGFTLMEMLIASGLSGLVMALALRGFAEMNRVSAKTVSTQKANSEASRAVNQIAPLLKRANILFYDARPINNRNGTEAQTRAADNLVNYTVAPAPYRGAVPGALEPPIPTAYIGGFRFTTYGPGGDRLRVAPDIEASFIASGASRDEVFFPGPLAYWAEAEFQSHNAAAASNAHALLPLRWTFYVLYVAPMYQVLPTINREPNLALPNVLRDRLQNGVDGGLRRTQAPLQLRLLTYPGVRAVRGHVFIPLNPPVADALAAPNLYHNRSGRAAQPGSTAPNNIVFLQPPYDYSAQNGVAGGTNGRAPNYDPLPIPYDSINLLDGNSRLNAAPPFNGLPPSGPRIAGAPAHSNFDDVGNDPPTQIALLDRDPAAGNVSDRQIVAYIDPDSPISTSVRLVNNIGSQADAIVPGNYRRLMNAIGPGNEYRDLVADSIYNLKPGETLPRARSGMGNTPTRAVVSVTVRYRSRSDVPFAFATVSTEVELDGVSTFRSVRRSLN